MIFKELSKEEQEHYIISTFTTAVKVSKTLPRVGPKGTLGIYVNISDRSVWDGWYEGMDRPVYSREQWTMFEKVLFEWREAFLKKGNISPIWKRLWVIFDDSLSIKIKEKKLGIGKSWIYSNRDQGVEILRTWLERRK